VAHTKIRTYALLEEGHKGTNWLQWRTRLQPIRTASEIEAHIKILPVRQIPLYQKHAQKATELHLLGIPQKQIAKTLNVSLKTIQRIIASFKTQRSNPNSLSSPQALSGERGSQSPSPVIPEFPEGKYPGSNKNKKRKET